MCMQQIQINTVRVHFNATNLWQLLLSLMGSGRKVLHSNLINHTMMQIQNNWIQVIQQSAVYSI